MIEFFSSYFVVFVSLYMMFIAFVIFMEGQNPDKTLLWLILIIALPVVGFFAYVLLGPDLKNRKRRKELRKRYREHKARLVKKLENCNDCDVRLETLLLNDSDAELTERNRVTTLIDGEETFGAIKEKLAQAKNYINMEYFSIFDDEIGNEIADILVERARSGVRVRVLYDDVGSWSLTRKYVQKLRGAGVEVHAFMPIVFAMLRRNVNYRNHRKIIVIDGAFAFLGGLNIGDMYLGKNLALGKWRDTHAMFEGQSVRKLNEIFVEDWCLCTTQKLKNENFEFASAHDLPKMGVQIAASAPDKGFRSIAHAFFHLIANAKKRLWITTPYLVPGEALLYALAVAAKSGVDVRIIIPEKADHKLVHWASVFFANSMLREGIRVYSYQDGFVHAKTIVADDDIVSLGTTNLDVRSLEINYEAQAFIYSREQNEIYAAQFARDIKSSRELTLEDMGKRAVREKIKDAIGRLWSSLL